MCRSTAAPLMAMAGMAGTALGVAIAVIREKAERRSLEREVEEELARATKESSSDSGDAEESDETRERDSGG